MSGTKINDLVTNSDQRQGNDDSMVDSIINELNNEGKDPSSQQQMPQ